MIILFDHNLKISDLQEYEMYMPDRKMRAYKLNETHLVRYIDKNQPFMVLRVGAGSLYILYVGEVLIVDREYYKQWTWFKNL